MQEIARNIYLISPISPPRYPYANCIFVKDDYPMLIDFGAGTDAFAELDSRSIKIGLFSHFHFDHLHCNVLFPEAAFYAGEEEKGTYCSEETYIHFHGYDRWDDLMEGIPRSMYGEVVPLAANVPIQPGFRSMLLAGTFADNQVIESGQRKIRAIHLPGHTAGHYGFYFEAEGILFSGDIDLVPTGPWYNSASGNVGDLLRSVRRIKDLDPAIIVPSHRRIQTQDLQKKLDRYIQVVIEREELIYSLLDKPRLLEDLYKLQLAFPNPANLYEVFWNRMTVHNHLSHLLEIQEIVPIAPGCYVRK